MSPRDRGLIGSGVGHAFSDRSHEPDGGGLAALAEATATIFRPIRYESRWDRASEFWNLGQMPIIVHECASGGFNLDIFSRFIRFCLSSASKMQKLLEMR